jgi:hypothetical protein
MEHASRPAPYSNGFLKHHALAALAFVAVALHSGPANAVIGGGVASLAEYPWQAQISYKGKHHCGGTLLSRTWVLTAAHCVAGPDQLRQDFTITLGEHSLSWPDLTEQVRQAAEIIPHPNYRELAVDNDVALIRLSSPVTFTLWVAPIDIARGDYPDGTTAMVSGWGYTEAGLIADELMEAPLPIVSNEVCSGTVFWVTIDGSKLCAGVPGTLGDPNIRGACGGDSGGPLVVTNAAGVKELIGVVNNGTFQCHVHTAFARARDFRPWVESVMATRPVVCSGHTPPGNTYWYEEGSGTIYTDVDTSACAWNLEPITAPLYFTSLGGNSSHYTIDGATSIYSPTTTGFRVYLVKSGLTPAVAESKKYHIKWQSVKTSTTSPDLCAGASPRTTWVQDGPDGIYMDVNTSFCGFSSTPGYFTSLAGTSSHAAVRGVASIYSPTATGFRVYINKSGVTTAYAVQRDWQINWRAERATNNDRMCNGLTPATTSWIQDGSNQIYTDVSTSACSIPTEPKFFTTLAGNSSHWTARTVTSIYSPTPDGFRVYLNKSGLTPAVANNLGWRVRWSLLP